MPRVIPFKTDPAVVLEQEAELGRAVTRVTEIMPGSLEFSSVDEAEAAVEVEVAAAPPDLDSWRRFGRDVIRARHMYGLDPRRFFVIRCGTEGCDEVYVISAGPRGGSWRGRCAGCGKKADRNEAEVIEEVEYDLGEERTHE